MPSSSFPFFVAVAFGLLAAANVQVSRTVDAVESGNTAKVTLDSGCSVSDEYGSNNCALSWGSTYTATVSATLSEVLMSNSTINADMKVDGLIPFKFSCPVCGADCTITVPIVKKTETFSMPPCPVTGQFDLNQKFSLPSSSPIPLDASIKGTVAITNGVGTTVAHVTVDAKIEPSLQSRKTLTLNKEFLMDYLNATTHYGDPKSGCEPDELAVQIQGVSGDFCTPTCSTTKACPTDVPSGVTASPQCALQTTTGDKYCALICSPSSNDDQCGSNASCKSISGVGICTYDD